MNDEYKTDYVVEYQDIVIAPPSPVVTEPIYYGEPITVNVSQAYAKPIEGIDDDGNAYKIWTCKPVLIDVTGDYEKWKVEGPGIMLEFLLEAKSERSRMLHEAADNGLPVTVMETIHDN